MKSLRVAFWVFVCLCGHLTSAALPVEAQAKPSSAHAKPAQATGTESQAREAFERGRIHYDNGDFARAAGAFEEAYKLSGREGLLYNLYLSYRDANEQEKAAEALRSFLTKVEVIENRAQLESRLKALEAGIAQRKANEAAERDRAAARDSADQKAAEQRAVAASAAPVETAAAAAEPGRWWLTPVVVMGAGGALMVGSLATGLMANSKSSELEDKCEGNSCPPELKPTADTGRTLALVTDVLLFSGLATAVVGGVLLLLKKPKKQADKETAAQTDVSCSRLGCSGRVSLRF